MGERRHDRRRRTRARRPGARARPASPTRGSPRFIQIGRRAAEGERPEHVGADVSHRSRGRLAGRRGRLRRAETPAVECHAQVAVRSHERAPEVGLAGIDRTLGTHEEEAVVGLGSQREDRVARVGVDEDLVPGGGAQRRAPLTQRVGRAYQAHGVDRVVHEAHDARHAASRARRRDRESGRSTSERSRRAHPVRASSDAGIASAPRCWSRSVRMTCRIKLLERGHVGEQSRRHGRLAVRHRQRDQLPQDDVASNAERRGRVHGGDAPHDRAGVGPEAVDHIVHGPREREMGAVQRMDTAPCRRRVVHPDVVHVGDDHREPHHELATLFRPPGQQDALDRLREIDDARRDVAHVDDSVIGEQRGMSVGGTERVVVAKCLQRRTLHHGPPETLLEHGSDLRGQMPVDRRSRRIGHRARASCACPAAGATATACPARSRARASVGAAPSPVKVSIAPSAFTVWQLRQVTAHPEARG